MLMIKISDLIIINCSGSITITSTLNAKIMSLYYSRVLCRSELYVTILIEWQKLSHRIIVSKATKMDTEKILLLTMFLNKNMCKDKIRASLTIRANIARILDEHLVVFFLI